MDDVSKGVIIRLKSNQGYLAVSETDKTDLYLTTADSSNSHWKVIANSDDTTIQLKNVYPTKYDRFLNRNRKGNKITTFDKGAGINWILHGEMTDSSQISLESYKGDFLYTQDNR